jgi:hypothetical protein
VIGTIERLEAKVASDIEALVVFFVGLAFRYVTQLLNCFLIENQIN